MSERQWNIKDNEARIILTTNCNYKCIFCHSEGFDPYTQCKWRPTKNGILEIIDKVLELECKDITLTGGEPLIHKDIVLDVIAHIAEKSPEASVTVITNASLLTKEWICEVRKYKNVRFNVSLHSCDPEQYKYITDQKSFHIDVIKDKLILLRDAEIPFKLNCVAMKELMTEDKLKGLTEFAIQTGATALKLIELLIMEQQEDMFSDYIAHNSIAKMLPNDFELSSKNSRRDEYSSKLNKLVIELQKCRCRFGCNQCLDVNTTCLNANGEFFPCFEYSGKSYDINKMGLEHAFEKGMNIIEELAEKYGDDSPSLIKDVTYQKRRKELYFEITDNESFNKFIKDFRLIEKREYSDYYFESPMQLNNQTIQMRVHQADKENSKLIISSAILEKNDNITYTSRIFQHSNKIPMIDKPDFIINTMKHLGWSISHKCKLYENSYDYKNCKLQVLNLNNDKILLSIFINDIDDKILKEIVDLASATIITDNIDEYLKKY